MNEEFNETLTGPAAHLPEGLPENGAGAEDGEKPLDKNVRLMSPGRMVARRFFRSKLSIIGLVMILSLILFSWVGPLIMSAIPNEYGGWGETETDYNGPISYENSKLVEVPRVENGEPVLDENGEQIVDRFYQVVETQALINKRSYPSRAHWLGTDQTGLDVFVRLMYGGQKSMAISFIAVFAIMIIGVIFGGIAGYFGGKVDNVIMRICDILMCLPGLPILLILGSVLDAMGVKGGDRIYYLMIFLTVFSWSGTARLVRGQILFLREQEYMVAAEAMGYSTARKIFKHLVPNVMPQLIVSMTLSLGSMILYEASLSYLGLGVLPPYASWGSMVNAAEDAAVLENYFNIWGPPGICIIIAVLGFNFVGDGLRDALDPKMRR